MQGRSCIHMSAHTAVKSHAPLCLSLPSTFSAVGVGPNRCLPGCVRCQAAGVGRTMVMQSCDLLPYLPHVQVLEASSDSVHLGFGFAPESTIMSNVTSAGRRLQQRRLQEDPVSPALRAVQPCMMATRLCCCCCCCCPVLQAAAEAWHVQADEKRAVPAPAALDMWHGTKLAAK